MNWLWEEALIPVPFCLNIINWAPYTVSHYNRDSKKEKKRRHWPPHPHSQPQLNWSPRREFAVSWEREAHTQSVLLLCYLAFCPCSECQHPRLHLGGLMHHSTSYPRARTHTPPSHLESALYLYCGTHYSFFRCQNKYCFLREVKWSEVKPPLILCYMSSKLQNFCFMTCSTVNNHRLVEIFDICPYSLLINNITYSWWLTMPCTVFGI